MRFRTFLVATFAVVAVATALANFATGGEGAGVLIDQTIPSLKNRAVTVPASSGTPENLAPPRGGVAAMSIQNTTTACIRCGDLTTVTSSAGLQIGDGCACGKLCPIDVANAFCIAEADASVAIDVIYGER